MRRRGFTLLEVMVAMGILSMGMTIILSSQAGLFATAKRVQSETYAANLMRCKMSEVELELLEDGYPLIEQSDSGECCEDEDSEFRCEWTIQTIELPQPAAFTESAEGEEGADSPMADMGASPLGDAAGLLPTAGGDALSGIAGVGDLASSLGDTAEGGGMIGMALSLVYPTLKPMLEASIRKIHVSVIWQEGEKERRMEAVQYVTNPLEGNLNPNAAEGLDDLTNLLGGGTVPGETDAASDDGGEE